MSDNGTKIASQTEEMVTIPKNLAHALCGVLASTLGLSAKDSVFIDAILSGEYRSLERREVDNLVLSAHRRCGGDVGSAVGYVFNNPELVGFGRHGGGHTFAQVIRTVIG